MATLALAVVVCCCSHAYRLPVNCRQWRQSPEAGGAAADGHRDAELWNNFLGGFRLGQASVEVFGEPFPQVAWYGSNSGDVPDPQLMPSMELKLLVAPPSADLRAYAAMADERDLTVLLPCQRGQSLDTLRGLEVVNGSGRLFPPVRRI